MEIRKLTGRRTVEGASRVAGTFRACGTFYAHCLVASSSATPRTFLFLLPPPKVSYDAGRLAPSVVGAVAAVLLELEHSDLPKLELAAFAAACFSFSEHACATTSTPCCAAVL